LRKEKEPKFPVGAKGGCASKKVRWPVKRTETGPSSESEGVRNMDRTSGTGKKKKNWGEKQKKGGGKKKKKGNWDMKKAECLGTPVGLRRVPGGGCEGPTSGR